jgi:hypothetical protein
MAAHQVAGGVLEREDRVRREHGALHAARDEPRLADLPVGRPAAAHGAPQRTGQAAHSRCHARSHAPASGPPARPGAPARGPRRGG